MGGPPGIPNPGPELSGNPNFVGLIETLFRVANQDPNKGILEDLFERNAARTLGSIIAFLLRAQATFARLLGAALLEAEEKSGDVIAEMCATGLSDVFGTPVGAHEVGRRRAPSGHRPLAARLGSQVLGALTGSLVNRGQRTPEDGRENAERVIGFALGLAIDGWIDSNFVNGIVSSWYPNYSQLDDTVAGVLGMGRLSSRALSPLIRAMVTLPFTRKLNLDLRPNLYSEPQALHALRAGELTEADYFEIMGQLGWSRERAGVLKLVNGKQLPPSELLRLRELGLIDEAEMVTLLTRYGYEQDTARVLARSLQEDRVRSARTALVTVARDMFRDREIGLGEFNSLLGEAGLSTLETSAYRAVADLERSRPRALAISTAEAAYVEGIITLATLHGHYVAAGYGPADVILLEQLAARRRAAKTK